MEYERRKLTAGQEAVVDLPDDEAEEDAAIPGRHWPDIRTTTNCVPPSRHKAAGKVYASLQDGDELRLSGDGLRGAERPER